MTTLQQHPHAVFDRYPQLVRGRIAEFGEDGIDAVVDRFVDAERTDFYWEGRLAEMSLGGSESLEDEDDEHESVAIVGYFRGRYYVAICIVDSRRRVRSMPKLRHFESFESAEQAFLAGGG